MFIPDHTSYVAERGNGCGYDYTVPLEPADFAAVFDRMPPEEPRRFAEMPAVLTAAVEHDAVLLQGEPGSGKSHILHDIASLCVGNSVPFLRLSIHINAGTVAHAKETQELLRTFQENAAHMSGRALCLLDNVDFVGFRNRTRKTGKAIDYAQKVVPSLISLVQSPDVITIGTAHSEEWRRRRWRWPEEGHYAPINAAARLFLNAFGEIHRFDGSMTNGAIQETLQERGVDAPQARDIADELGRMGMSQFVYASHIDPQAFMEGSSRACQLVDAGRELRTGPTR